MEFNPDYIHWETTMWGLQKGREVSTFVVFIAWEQEQETNIQYCRHSIPGWEYALSTT